MRLEIETLMLFSKSCRPSLKNYVVYFFFIWLISNIWLEGNIMSVYKNMCAKINKQNMYNHNKSRLVYNDESSPFFNCENLSALYDKSYRG